ncbi:MAG: hypothetical protein DUD27_02645 [Lachnospiraceae bacterium]|nr:MAG: hypothetical protein DUD27_02645 [Lachnospiraceae bacterium]
MEETESIYGPYRPELEKIQKELLDDIESLRNELKEKNGMDPVEHCLSRIKDEDSMREKCVRKGLPVTTESALTKIYDAVGIRVVCAFLDDVYKFREHLVALPGAEVIEEKDYIKHAKPNGYRSYHMILRMHGKFYAEIQLRTISQDTWAALEHQIKYKHAKPNGYRSYHMILRMHGKFYAEIQLRTISQDTWAALEHQIKYKHAKPNGYRSYHMILRMHGKFYAEIQLRTISQDTWAALEHQIKYKHDLSGTNEELVTSELKRCADELASTDISMQTIRDLIFEETSDIKGSESE